MTSVFLRKVYWCERRARRQCDLMGNAPPLPCRPLGGSQGHVVRQRRASVGSGPPASPSGAICCQVSYLTSLRQAFWSQISESPSVYLNQNGVFNWEKKILQKSGSWWKSSPGPQFGLFLPLSPLLESQSSLCSCFSEHILSSFSVGLPGTQDPTLMVQSHLYERPHSEDTCLYIQIYISVKKETAHGGQAFTPWPGRWCRKQMMVGVAVYAWHYHASKNLPLWIGERFSRRRKKWEITQLGVQCRL